MTETKERGVWAWNLVKLIVGLSLLLYATFFMIGGFNEEVNRQWIRWSGKIAFVCFCIAFVASSFHLFVQNSFSFWVLMNRKYWGISFAIIHLSHLFFIGILQFNFHPVFNRAATSSLIGGGIGYAFALVMLLTSFPMFANWLSSKQWKLVHTIGGYWIWAIFLTTYFKRTHTEPIHWIFVLVLLLVLLMRLGKLLKK